MMKMLIKKKKDESCGSLCKYFGTDGIRGRVGESLINPFFVLHLGWAIGVVLKSELCVHNKILIGKDTRISGYLLESALEAGLSAAGVNINLIGPIPTPAIAYLTRTFRAKAGIAISASHNPYYDNGIKIFSDKGIKLQEKYESQIEFYLDRPIKMVDPSCLGKASRINDAHGRYIEFCKGTLGLLSRNLKNFKIAIDCANGATYKVAPLVFSELESKIVASLGTSPNGVNINENCGSTHIEMLAKLVLKEQADIGIAFDGDGDRVIMVDHKGNVVDGDILLFILAKYLHENNELYGGVVGTIMSNLGLEIMFKKMKIPFLRAQVGDKYLLDKLNKNKWFLGGESSGHIVNLNVTTSGDGIINAIQILKILSIYNKNLYEIVKEITIFPRILINVLNKNNVNFEVNNCLERIVKAAKKDLGKMSQILIRKSGTEPVVRIMVEGENENKVKKWAKEIENNIIRHIEKSVEK